MNTFTKTLLLMSFFSLPLVSLGCSKGDSHSEKTQASAEDVHTADSMKAIADAEAAEEAVAQAKSAKRSVASVKGSKHSKSDESIYVVQVGTFRVEENAKRIAEKLKSVGLPVFQKKIEKNGVAFYAVRIEPTPNRVEAEKFASSIKAATGESSLILSVGK